VETPTTAAARNFGGYSELIWQRIQSELDGLERAVKATSLENPERQKALVKIADVKAEPSPDKVKSLVQGIKAAGEIGTSAAPFLTAIARLMGLA